MGYLRFATNDDTTMLAIAAGGYGGKPSPYVVNIHCLLGYILNALYTVIPDINWFTVLYLSMYAIALFFILYIIRKSCRSNRSLCSFGFVIVTVGFYLLLSFFSFTVAAYALLTAGMSGLLYSMEAEGTVQNKSTYVTVKEYPCGIALRIMEILSVVLIVLAAMMRTDVINTAIVMVVVYGSVAWIGQLAIEARKADDESNGNRERLLRIAIILGVLAIIETASYASNKWLLTRDKAESEFYQWGETRSKALDCAQVPYNEELFTEYGFSKASYEACYGAFYYVRDAVSEDKMRTLIDLNKKRYNPHVIGFIKAHFTAYIIPGFRRIWQGMFVLVMLAGLVIGSRIGRIQMIALYTAVISADYAYHFIQRPMLHVMMPTYVMGSIIGGVLLATDQSSGKTSGEEYNRMSMTTKIVSALTLMVVAVAIIGIHQETARYSMTLTADQVESLHEGREYMRAHPDKLFFALDPAVFAVSTDEDMWHNRYAEEPYNLAGNWEIYSVPSDAMFASYGIDHTDPGRELVNNDTAVFLQSDNVDTDPNESYIIDLYKEYYGMSVRFELIDSLKNGWRSYRLIEVS